MPWTQQEFRRCLEDIAPLSGSEPWDNTGMLLENSAAGPIRRIFLTIDLTEQVLQEAIDQAADMIVAYHPPIFKGIKRLTMEDPKTRVLLRATAAGISIYSPHTALDSVTGGMADWLCEAVDAKEIIPLGEAQDARGPGRLLTLSDPQRFLVVAAQIQRHLGANYLRVARSHAAEEMISTIALCPGSGYSVLAKASCDMALTGEMRHHDVLECVASGRHVVISEHTHTERGFLKRLAERLDARSPGEVQVSISQMDRDPLHLFHA